MTHERTTHTKASHRIFKFWRNEHPDTLIESADDFMHVLSVYYSWYKGWSIWWGIGRVTLELAMYISSIVTVLLATDVFQLEDPNRWIVISTIVTTSMGAALSQFQFRRMKELREEGRIECESIYLHSRLKLAELKDKEQEVREFKEQVLKRLYDLDMRQFGGYASILQSSHTDDKETSAKNFRSGSRPI